MAVATRANGVTVKLTVEENFIMPMAIFMRVTGSMTRQMVTEPTLTLMAPSMSDRGATISSTDLVWRLGQTVLYMRVSTTRARRMAEASLHLPMAPCIKENSK